MNSKVGVPASVIRTDHELWCTLAKLFWVVHVESLGDNCMAIDRYVQILIEVGVKRHNLEVVPNNLVCIFLAFIIFCVEIILRKDKMSQVDLLVHVSCCFFACEERECIVVDKEVIFMRGSNEDSGIFFEDIVDMSVNATASCH